MRVTYNNNVRKKFPKRNPKNELEAFFAPSTTAMSSSASCLGIFFEIYRYYLMGEYVPPVYVTKNSF